MRPETKYTIHFIEGRFELPAEAGGIYAECEHSPRQEQLTAPQLYKVLRKLADRKWDGLTLGQLRKHLAAGVNAVLHRYKDDGYADVVLARIAAAPQLVGTINHGGVLQ